MPLLLRLSILPLLLHLSTFLTLHHVGSLAPPDPTTDEVRIGFANVVNPDPNPCREKGGTDCCNRMYFNDFRKKDQAQWELYFANEKDYESGRYPGMAAPVKPTVIDWDNFDLFEAQAMPAVRARRPNGALVDSFMIICWLALANSDLFRLIPELNPVLRRQDASDWSDDVRHAKPLRVQCAIGERVDHTTMRAPSRRKWRPSGKPVSTVYPYPLMPDARCVPITEQEWREYQKEIATTAYAKGLETKRKNEEILQQSRRLERSSKRSKVLAENTKVVQPGTAGVCLELPRPSAALAANNMLVLGDPAVEEKHAVKNTAPDNGGQIAQQIKDQFKQLIDQNSISLYARTALPAQYVPDLGYDRRYLAAEQYQSSIDSSSIGSEWDYPELYPTGEAAPVQSLDFRLVSRNIEQMNHPTQTVMDQAVGPLSYLDLSLSEAVHMAQSSQRLDPPNAAMNAAALEDLGLGAMVHACVTTFPTGPPIEFQTGMFQLPSPKP